MNEPQASSDDVLTLHMEGIPPNGGDMLLPAFINKLDEFRSALSETDKFLSGGDATVQFLVKDLSHSSPSAVTIGWEGAGITAAHQEKIFPYFGRLVDGLTNGTVREVDEAAYPLLDKLLALAAGLGKEMARMWLSRQGADIAAFTPETVKALEDLLGTPYQSYGSAKGRVEAYNSHSKEKFFYLYPIIGQRIKCVFDESRRTKASGSVDKSVTVTGLVKYRRGSFVPFEIAVGDIEEIPADSELPSLSSFEGIAPNATGDIDSVEFVRKQRDGWH
ncbi:MAG: hypothetical protein ACRCWJ_09875 [Casimicrobium sp.]